MIRRYLRLIPLLFILTMATTACGDDATADDGRLLVVATTGQIADSVRNVAGNAAEVRGLLGPGVDPHLYVPTESNVTLFNDADVIFWNGITLEAQMARILTQIGERGTPVVALGEQVPRDRLILVEGGEPDPHIWNEPELWKIGVEAIRDTLMEADPENAELYRSNAEQFLAEIDETDAFVREELARIPENRRYLITAHDAFGYFGRAYDLEVLGLQGLSTESEASTADVQALADFIVENEVPAIFVESSVPPRTIEALQAAVRDRDFDVAIGDELFSDALGEEGSGADTYLGMLRHNAMAVAGALAGE